MKKALDLLNYNKLRAENAWKICEIAEKRVILQRFLKIPCDGKLGSKTLNF